MIYKILTRLLLTEFDRLPIAEAARRVESGEASVTEVKRFVQLGERVNRMAEHSQRLARVA